MVKQFRRESVSACDCHFYLMKNLYFYAVFIFMLLTDIWLKIYTYVSKVSEEEDFTGTAKHQTLWEDVTKLVP